MKASVCGKCSAAAEFLAKSWSEIFLQAVAEAEVQLEGAANGKSIKAASNSFVEAVADATVTAYAQVLHLDTCTAASIFPTWSSSHHFATSKFLYFDVH